VWDVRSSSSLPVRRTALGGNCHTHPVYSMTYRREHSGWSLVTASSDGKVCEFDPRNLLSPKQTLPLSFLNDSSEHMPISVSCMSLCSSNVEGLADVALVGTESGDVFAAQIDGSHTSSLKKVLECWL
jgi:dynein intermediate chain, cytosolic